MCKCVQQTVPGRLCNNLCLSLSIITQKVIDLLVMSTVSSRCIQFISNFIIAVVILHHQEVE